jgi:hypothetical protein
LGSQDATSEGSFVDHDSLLPPVLLSTLNFVDLAGSESYTAGGPNPKSQQEGSHINKSLLALGKVIRALGEEHSQTQNKHHVPYRDSRLTRILQASLGE